MTIGWCICTVALLKSCITRVTMSTSMRGSRSGERTIAEWPRCLVDLIAGSVGAESIAIIGSFAGREGAKTGKGESKEDRWAGLSDKR